MAEGIKPLKRVRERIAEIKYRRPLMERGQIQIGKGALIDKAKQVTEKVTTKISELRPGILPKVGEILSEWYPGKRLTQILTPKGQIKVTEEFVKRPPKELPPAPTREGFHY